MVSFGLTAGQLHISETSVFLQLKIMSEKILSSPEANCLSVFLCIKIRRDLEKELKLKPHKEGWMVDTLDILVHVFQANS